jgi:hypothetical protein
VAKSKRTSIKGKGRHPNPQEAPELAAEFALRDLKIFQLRRKGYEFQTVADILGASINTVRDAYYRHLRAIPTREVEELRRDMVERLAYDRQCLVRKIETFDHKMKTPENIHAIAALYQQLIAIEKHEADLLGLKAPIKIESPVVGPDADEMTKLIQSNLTVDEQRQMLHLMRKARGLLNGSGPVQPAIETTARPVEEP